MHPVEYPKCDLFREKTFSNRRPRRDVLAPDDMACQPDRCDGVAQGGKCGCAMMPGRNKVSVLAVRAKYDCADVTVRCGRAVKAILADGFKDPCQPREFKLLKVVGNGAPTFPSGPEIHLSSVPSLALMIPTNDGASSFKDVRDLARIPRQHIGERVLVPEAFVCMRRLDSQDIGGVARLPRGEE
jgi:hypothetical protein